MHVINQTRWACQERDSSLKGKKSRTKEQSQVILIYQLMDNFNILGYGIYLALY